jgi:hypothetical protein
MDLASSAAIGPNICWPRQIAVHFPERRLHGRHRCPLVATLPRSAPSIASAWARACAAALERHLLASPGRSVNPEVVALKIADLNQHYRIRGLAYDRWRIEDPLRIFRQCRSGQRCLNRKDFGTDYHQLLFHRGVHLQTGVRRSPWKPTTVFANGNWRFAGPTKKVRGSLNHVPHQGYDLIVTDLSSECHQSNLAGSALAVSLYC